MAPSAVEFVGSALDDLRALPMSTVGAGVKEIRIRDVTGAFRVLYIAKFAKVVYVLHCFQKKSEKTCKVDLDLAAKRYRHLLKELKP
ncbi:type II toxin-antitoxin system RelE/ParE family toxin [Achromobacter spanius]|nr:type II toxin-antitoxin system RelE/ParE family toxin [Achromobacter spanius]